jgi:hypothetical protein
MADEKVTAAMPHSDRTPDPHADPVHATDPTAAADSTQPAQSTNGFHDDETTIAPTEKRATTASSSGQKGPAGGFDSTPIPHAPPGWTVKITFHGAHNLPMADFNTFSSDPYLEAQLYTSLPTRHKEDPPLKFRTPTIRRSTEPQWESEWIIAHVPSDGFRIKARLYDEDPADSDDRLGNVHIPIGPINDARMLVRKADYNITKRMASKRAYVVRIVAACLDRTKHISGYLTVSVEVLGRTPGEGGRAYTIGPQNWVRHYSPLLGRLTGVKDTGSDLPAGSRPGRKIERYK